MSIHVYAVLSPLIFFLLVTIPANLCIHVNRSLCRWNANLNEIANEIAKRKSNDSLRLLVILILDYGNRIEIDESRRWRKIRRGAKIQRWNVKKKRKKKRQEDKEGRTRGGIRKLRSAAAHLRIVMLTLARSNNRHQAQWRNPCWKGGKEVVEAESKGWGQSQGSAGRETLSHYRIAAPRCRDSLCPYVNSCKQRFTPIQPWARYRHPPCCFLFLTLLLLSLFYLL